MSSISVNSSGMTNGLVEILGANDIVPGDAPSYQTCKAIYTFHPLGAKLAEKPITMAQSQPRDIAVTDGPEMDVKEQFEREWSDIGADKAIFQLAVLSRIYGAASIAALVEGKDSAKPIDLKTLYKSKMAFNCFDPLNTAGSLVINQQPNAMDFLKTDGSITVQGQKYHPSRTCVMMNEQAIYISYTVSAFGFVGRSVYQRILFPLKSFIETMRTDDLVAVKSGLVVAKLEQAGSIVDAVMGKMMGIKRALIKEAKTYNVLSISTKEDVQTLNMQNLDGAFELARKNILENIAAGADDMPAKLLNQETFAEGFGEGTEDAKAIAKYIQRIREKLEPAYRFFDTIVQHRAWNPDFYATIQAKYPEYANVPYETAFYQWVNSFKAKWPDYLEEPPSEKVKVDDVKLKAVIAMVQVLLPAMDPENKSALIEWACDNFNELKLLFGSPLELDFEALKDYEPEEALEEPGAPRPFAANDAVEQFTQAVNRLTEKRPRLKVAASN